jgi:uncharacterized protein YdeI (YjbR/CyaY-like superfamily)
MNPKVDQYLIDGCMRCKYGGTPQCKVNNWRTELETLRHLVLDCGLTEEVKWGVPCYTSNGKNIVVVSAFKDYASLSFFKGTLLKDPHKILVKQGENSQSGRLIKFTNTDQIIEQQSLLKAYVLEAVKLEESGVKVEFEKNPEPVPDELLERFVEFPALKKSFYALTPGRQRGYIIYFSQPKTNGARLSRIEKCQEKILKGEGLHDKYSSGPK